MTAETRKRILVIGGTAPPGSAIVEHLSRAGSRVAFNGIDRGHGAEIAEAAGAAFMPGDYLREVEVDRVVSEAAGVLGGLDGLVWADRLVHAARISETTDTAWDAVLERNLVAPFRFAKASMPLLSEGGGIVFVVSGTAARAEMELGACSAAGKALLWLSSMLAVEGGPRGVAVNAICLGDMEAAAATSIGEPQLRELGPPFVPPAGRLASPEEVARAVDFFIRRNDGTCTGASLTIDGGLRAALRAHKVRNP